MARRILIVEDDHAIRETLGAVLEFEGHTIRSANDGQEALELLRQETVLPDVILLDYRMPVKDGLWFRKEQQNDPRLASIPVVLMTADSQIETVRKLSGLRDAIAKPLDLEGLFSAIDRSVS
jgi:CheY-like chemotaxis protein